MAEVDCVKEKQSRDLADRLNGLIEEADEEEGGNNNAGDS